MGPRIFKHKSHQYVLTVFLIMGGVLGMLVAARADETASSTPAATSTPEQIVQSASSSTPTSTEPITLPTPETATTTPDNQPTSTVGIASSTSLIVNLNLRYQNNLIFSGPVVIPSSTVITDSSGNSYNTTSTNVLTALLAADSASSNFAITDLQYYAAWNSFYVKCIGITAPTTTALCDNWNYVVNANYPSVGMDSYSLNGGENIYVYFDNPWRLTVSSSTVTQGATTTFYTWRYNYDNLANEWMADPNDLIDISVPNPSSTGWWDTTLTVSTTQSNELGEARFVFNSTGTYYAKITSLDWTKWTFPTTITVLDNVVSTTPATTTVTAPPSSPPLGRDPAEAGQGGAVGGVVSGNGSTLSQFNISNAIGFISAYQNPDGSFTPAFLNDWVAIAMASYQPDTQTYSRLKNYLLADPNPGANTTDFERRAMALQALNINPYTGTATNYIQKILDSFDGGQFGDRNLFNDDIFALIPLLRAGYSASENVIASSTSFILSFQQSNGSWGEVDSTAASIQALTQLRDLPNVNNALDRAKAYLRGRQLDNGGLGNVFSTSWAMQAISALGESDTGWTRNNISPSGYMATQQSSDGGMNVPDDNSSRLWATTYAIPAYLGKPWPQILNGFSRPSSNSSPGSLQNNAPAVAYTSSSASSTFPLNTPTSTSSATATSSFEQILQPTTTSILTVPSTLPRDNETAFRGSQTGQPASAQTSEQATPVTFSSIRPTPSNRTESRVPADLPVSAQPSSSLTTTTEITKLESQSLQAGPVEPEQAILANVIEQLPLDSPTRRTAKRALAISGGGTLALAAYLGLKLLKNVV